MRQLWTNSLIICSMAISTSVMATPQLFNIELKGATRNQIRTALQNTNVSAVREDDQYWIDKYNANGVLQGATDLNFGYSSNGKFAYAEYKFPAFVDTNKIVQVARLVATKYGKPSQSSGDLDLGEASMTWNFKNGMAIDVYRGWPNTTTYMRYRDKQNYPNMLKEINEVKRQQEQAQIEKQNNAF